ncbi:hypothetical protein M758_UG020700, partial [Ceratodon purpureus]
DCASPPWGSERRTRRSMIADVESARATCALWRSIIDYSTEWACIRLARWDYEQETGAHWFTCADHEVVQFAPNWSVFGRSWRMLRPIREDRLRLSPIGNLYCTELQALRTFLQDSGNQEIWVAPGVKLSPTADIWVCKGDREWF